MDRITRELGPVIARIEIRASGAAILKITERLRPESEIGSIVKGIVDNNHRLFEKR